MYDSIYLSELCRDFRVPLAVLIGVSFKQLKQARRLAALLAETAIMPELGDALFR